MTTDLSMTSATICRGIEAATGVTTSGDALGYLQTAYRHMWAGNDPRPDMPVHSWTWLHCPATLRIGAPITGTATGTVAGVTTATTAIFDPSMIARTMTISDTPSRTAIITEYHSPTVVVTDDTVGFSGEGVSIDYNGVYSLPDDFGGMDEPFIYPRTTVGVRYPMLTEQSAPIVESIWQRSLWDESQIPAVNDQHPQCYAIVNLPFATATGSRFAVWFAPVPTASVYLQYRYLVNPAPLADDTNYPLGGPGTCETLLHMALGHWELSTGHGKGVWCEEGDKGLVGCIERDKQLWRTLGQMRMNSSGPRPMSRFFRRR